MDHPTITQQFDSDERGQHILRAALSGAFIVRDYRPDIFLDYCVEMRLGREPSGRRAFIQLKSHEDLRTSNRFAKVQVGAKALSYYLHKSEDPVFIVAADIKSRRAFYLFIQKWLLENRNTVQSRGNKRITVDVPLTNDLGNIPDFISAINEARQFMREMRPGSPAAALASFSEALSSVDPRFKVDAFVTPLGTNFKISSEIWPDVGLTVMKPGSLKSTIGTDEINKAFGYGMGAHVENVRIRTRGSKLMKLLCDTEELVSFKVEKRCPTDCLVEITIHGNSNTSFRLPAHATEGKEGIGVRTIGDGCPIAFEIMYPNKLPKKDQVQQFGITFLTGNWNGKPILSLPWFEEVFSIIHNGEGREISINLLQDNELKDTIERVSFRISPTDWVVTWITLISKMRAIAAYSQSNPLLPKISELNAEEATEWFVSADYLILGEHKQESDTAFLDEKIAADLFCANGEYVGFVNVSGESRITFLGKEIYIGKTKMTNPAVRVRPTGKRDSAGAVEVEIRPVMPETNLTYKIDKSPDGTSPISI